MSPIRPKDNREIAGTGVWTPFKKASEWKRGDIPRHPGLYNVIAVDSNDQTIAWPTPSGTDPASVKRADRVLRKEFPGVLYVGKACNLQDRFWKLIRSWSDSKKMPSDCHGSRETWDSSPAFKGSYPFTQMRFRCMPVSGSDWKKLKAAAEEGGLESILAGVPGTDTPLGHDRTFPVVEHLSIREYQAIARYHQYAGALPALNRIAGEHPGDLPDQAWWLQHQSEQQRLATELAGLFIAS